jgi:hypothetical protein
VLSKSAGNFSGTFDSSLKEVLVGCRGGFDLDVSNKAWLAVFIVGFSGIHAVSFDTLVALGAIAGIGIIGVLHAVCAYPLLVP